MARNKTWRLSSLYDGIGFKIETQINNTMN